MLYTLKLVLISTFFPVVLVFFTVLSCSFQWSFDQWRFCLNNCLKPDCYIIACYLPSVWYENECENSNASFYRLFTMGNPPLTRVVLTFEAHPYVPDLRLDCKLQRFSVYLGLRPQQQQNMWDIIWLPLKEDVVQ